MPSLPIDIMEDAGSAAVSSHTRPGLAFSGAHPSRKFGQVRARTAAATSGLFYLRRLPLCPILCGRAISGPAVSPQVITNVGIKPAAAAGQPAKAGSDPHSAGHDDLVLAMEAVRNQRDAMQVD